MPLDTYTHSGKDQMQRFRKVRTKLYVTFDVDERELGILKKCRKSGIELQGYGTRRDGKFLHKT